MLQTAQYTNYTKRRKLDTHLLELMQLKKLELINETNKGAGIVYIYEAFVE